MDYVITGGERNGDGYFTVRWSPLRKADKYDIARSVPAMGGVAELYAKDAYGKLELFCVARSWYGGLRSVIRERTDPVLEKDPFRLGVLVKARGEIWYRWSLSESNKDMSDVLYFFMETYSPGSRVVEHSGRYARIFLDEIDADRIVTV